MSLDAKIQKTGDCGRFFPENVENKNRRLRENNPVGGGDVVEDAAHGEFVPPLGGRGRLQDEAEVIGRGEVPGAFCSRRR